MYSAYAQLIDRFCKALLDLCGERNAVETVHAELIQLRDAIAQNHELKIAVTSPLLTAEQQESAMSAILKQSGASETLIGFVAMLARRRRLALLPEIADAFAAKLSELRGEIVAEVTSTRAFDAKQMQNLQTQLQQIFTGKKILVKTAIDPEILGGIKVRVGSTLIDSSLRTKLDGLSLALRGAA